MANTPNYNLKKVEYTEIADIPGHFNANFDTIDTAMKNNADAATAAEVNAKSYASGLIGTLSNLLTTAKNNIVVAVNEIFGKVEDVEADLIAHKADYASLLSGGQDFELTLLRGWTGTVIYSKNDLEEVWVRGSAIVGELAFPISIGLLPSAYRPTYSVPVNIINNTTNTVLTDNFIVNTSGNLLLINTSGLTEGDTVIFNFSFKR